MQNKIYYFKNDQYIIIIITPGSRLYIDRFTREAVCTSEAGSGTRTVDIEDLCWRFTNCDTTTRKQQSATHIGITWDTRGTYKLCTCHSNARNMKKKGRSKTLLQQFHSTQNVLQNYQTTLKNARVLISTSLIRTTQQRNTQQHSRDYQATRQLFTLQNFTHDTTGVVLTNGRGCKQYRHERQTRTFCRCKI